MEVDMKRSLSVFAMIVFGFLSQSALAAGGPTAVTIASGYLDETTGTVTITGTVTCSADTSSATVAVDVSAKQPGGNNDFASGSTTTVISSAKCKNRPAEYIAHFVSSSTAPFQAGVSTTVNVFAHNTNEKPGDLTASATSDLYLNP
jgi:hypothetical protein